MTASYLATSRRKHIAAPPPPDANHGLRTLGGPHRGRLLATRTTTLNNEQQNHHHLQQYLGMHNQLVGPDRSSSSSSSSTQKRASPAQLSSWNSSIQQQQQQQKKKNRPDSPTNGEKEQVLVSPSDGTWKDADAKKYKKEHRKRNTYPGISVRMDLLDEFVAMTGKGGMDGEMLELETAQPPPPITEDGRGVDTMVSQQQEEQVHQHPPPATRHSPSAASWKQDHHHHPHQQRQRQPQFPTNMDHLTQVDGRNMWQNWKRNFTSPLTAIWDLLDNAFDAADPVSGRLQIFADPPYDDSSTTTVSARTVSAREQQRRHTIPSGGLVLMNTSEKRIKDIDMILKPYSSSKTNNQDAIGENGIGVKQAAAALSDLSFVLTKNDPTYPNGTTTVSLGIIAKALQNENGVYFPSTKIVVPISNDLGMYSSGSADHAIQQALEDFVTKSGTDVKTVLAQYSGCGVQDDNTYKRSVKRMAFHIKEMVFSPKWAGSKYVYCIIVHHLLHGGSSNDGATATTHLKQLVKGMPAQRTSRVLNKSKAWTLLEEIHREAPRQYLHVDPKFIFEIGTNGDNVSFSYWQRRLVEFTRAFIPINKTVDNNTKEGMPLRMLSGIEQKPAPKNSRQDGTNSSNDNVYNLEVYCGFDAMRVGEQGKTDCLLFVYSRKRGRLVKIFEDGRSFLGLNNTSDAYCQGLTIIIDDKDGMLPLNPTKHDLAFSEKAYGSTHEKNIKLCIKSLSKAYYEYHLKNFGGKKMQLRKGVINLHERAQKLVQSVDKRTLDNNLDKFVLLQMDKLRPEFGRHGFRLAFEGLEGSALMRFHYPTVEEEQSQSSSATATMNGANSSSSIKKRRRATTAAGHSPEQHSFYYPQAAGPPFHMKHQQQIFKNCKNHLALHRQRRIAAQQDIFMSMNGGKIDERVNGFNRHFSKCKVSPQPAAKKRKNGSSVGDTIDLDTSSGSDDELSKQAHIGDNVIWQQSDDHDSRVAEKLAESRGLIIRLQAELAAMKSKFGDVQKDFTEKDTDLIKENQELKDLVIEMRDKKNDYKMKYKESQKEAKELRKQLEGYIKVKEEAVSINAVEL